MIVSAHAATLSLNDLASQTADKTTAPDSVMSKADFWKGQDTKDVTFQFSATLVVAPSSGDYALFEVGASAYGTSLVLQPTRLAVQTDADGSQDQNTGSVLGGNNGGEILNADLPYGDGQSHQFTVSLHLDHTTPSNSILNLFIDDVLKLSVSPVTDKPSTYSASSWAGGNKGAYFLTSQNPSGVLYPAGNEAAFKGPDASLATADSDLNIYYDTFVESVPEPSSVMLLAFGGLGIFLRRRR